jgi:hypothetical protein
MSMVKCSDEKTAQRWAHAAGVVYGRAADGYWYAGTTAQLAAVGAR